MFSLLIIAVVSFVYAQQFKEALQDRIFLQLSSIRHLKTIEIQNLLDNHQHEIERMLDNLDNEAYLDALGEDDIVQIDSIVMANNDAYSQPNTRAYGPKVKNTKVWVNKSQEKTVNSESEKTVTESVPDKNRTLSSTPKIQKRN